MRGRKFTWLALSFFGLLLACNALSSTADETVTPAATSAADQAAPPPTSPTTEEPAAMVPSPGATYYVAPEGDDSSDGGAEDPWATLQHAANSVAPGDTILVQSGTYVGARVERSGTAEAWITLKAAPGAQVLVNAPGPNNEHESDLEFETWEGDGIVAFWLVEGLEVSNAPNWGIDMRGNEDRHSHHFVIRGNDVHDNGLESETTGIFTAFVDDIVIEDNDSHSNGEHGIYLSNSGDRFRVEGNRLFENADCGLHMNGDASMGGDGVISDGVVEGNVIFENGRGGCAAINMDGVTGAVVRNNLIYQNHAGGIAIYQEDGGVCSRDNRILNNTIVMAADGRWAINLSDTSCTNNQLYNNIIYSYHDWRGSILIPSPNIAGFESDYNVVMDRFSADDDNSVISLAEWQALGFDTNSLIATPDQLFSGPAEFHLRAGSPAVDAGLALPDVINDLSGISRPAGTGFDIGAYELSGMSLAETATPPPAATAPQAPAAGAGMITYTYEGRVYRLPAEEGAAPEDISAALEALSPGSSDEGLNVSPDGAWLVLISDRFDPECPGWPCLALVAADLSEGAAIRAGGEAVHAEGFAAAASGGRLIVYSLGDGPHAADLWAVSRTGEKWDGPLLLTADSPYDYNHQPALSDDGRFVLFDCGEEPYGAAGTAICEVGTDGKDFRVILTPADNPPGFPAGGALNQPDYAPDGSIVFEADWGGEQIWRLPAGGGVPVLVAAEFTNDNSPCVLPDGRIVSLWLNREGGQGFHELKVMTADGQNFFVPLPDLDIWDVGVGCGA